VYVLRLEGGRYYVGKTDNVMNRYQQHLSGSGSAWTRKYKPVSLEKCIENVSSFEEDKVTKEYMSKYGIDKVRGGSYVEVELSKFHIDALKMEIWGAKDLCTQCGRAGHFVKDCRAKKDVSGNTIEYEEEEEEVVWGCEYCDRTFTTEFGCRVHEKSCRSKNTRYLAAGALLGTSRFGSGLRYPKQKTAKKEDGCYRCGRSGHYITDCYASTHTKGYTLDSDCESDYESY
jgi:predicted GIY-YIG superfamily endonuclease